MRKTRNNIISVFFLFYISVDYKTTFRHRFPMQMLEKYGFPDERAYLKARDFSLRFSPAFIRQAGFLKRNLNMYITRQSLFVQFNTFELRTYVK